MQDPPRHVFVICTFPNRSGAVDREAGTSRSHVVRASARHPVTFCPAAEEQPGSPIRLNAQCLVPDGNPSGEPRDHHEAPPSVRNKDNPKEEPVAFVAMRYQQKVSRTFQAGTPLTHLPLAGSVDPPLHLGLFTHATRMGRNAIPQRDVPIQPIKQGFARADHEGKQSGLRPERIPPSGQISFLSSCNSGRFRLVGRWYHVILFPAFKFIISFHAVGMATHRSCLTFGDSRMPLSRPSAQWARCLARNRSVCRPR